MSRRDPFSASALLGLMVSVSAAGQTNQQSVNLGSVPSGTASKEVLHLTLRDAITMAVRYNLGQIESGENARIAHGQRLHAMSTLLPQINAGAAENVEQFSASTLGIKVPQVPSVIGPFSFSTAQANASLSLFNFESIQRFHAARNNEQAAQLTYNDTLDVITLIVGTAYLEVIQANSRIEAEEAQVKNAQALYDQAADQLQSGTSTKIDETRSGVQLHTEQYNLSIAQKNFAIAKLNLSRAIGLAARSGFRSYRSTAIFGHQSPNHRRCFEHCLQNSQRFPGRSQYRKVRPAAAFCNSRRALSSAGG